MTWLRVFRKTLDHTNSIKSPNWPRMPKCHSLFTPRITRFRTPKNPTDLEWSVKTWHGYGEILRFISLNVFSTILQCRLALQKSGILSRWTHIELALYSHISYSSYYIWLFKISLSVNPSSLNPDNFQLWPNLHTLDSGLQHGPDFYYRNKPV